MSLRTTVATLLALCGAAAFCAQPALAQRGGAFPADPMSWTHAAPPGPASLPGAEESGGNRGGRGGGGRAGRSEGNPLEASDGARLLTQAGVACRPSDGKLMSSRGREASYELACHDGFGWIVTRDGQGQVSAYDCLAIATSTKGERHCLLPANRSQLPGLQALADKGKTGCAVVDGMWQGQGGTPPVYRYEAKCAGGRGLILDAPGPASKADLVVTDCKDAAAFQMSCALTKPQ